MANESTTKLDIDISGLKKNIQEANRLMRVANSEFKAASAGMGDWAKSADGITAKLTQLNKVSKSQATVLSSLEKQYEAVVAEEGEASKSAQELLIKINNQKAAIAKTNAEINKWNDALDELKNGSNETVTATQKLTQEIADQQGKLNALKSKYSDIVLEQGEMSDEAKDTAKQIQALSAELNDSKSKLSQAEKAADDLEGSLDEVGTSAKESTGGFTIMKGAIADLVASGIKTLVSGFVNLAAESREYRNEMAKLDTAFTTAGHSSQAATTTFKELNGVLGDEGQAVEAANHLAQLANNEKDLATWTDIATGVYATFGASLPIEGLTEAANETAKTGQLTGALADSLNWAGISEDDFQAKLDKCTTEQERQKLIMDTLNKTYKDASNQYKETNADVIAANKAQTDLTDAYAKLGAKAEPIITTIKQGMADLLNKAIDLVNGVDFSKVSAAVEDGFKYLTDTVLPAVKTGFQWILDNKDGVIAGVVGIGTAFVAWKVVGIVQGVTAALKGMSAAQVVAAAKQWLLNAAMSANPIGIVIGVIAGLVAAFITLWNTSDEFRAFWINLWEIIKKHAGKAIDSVKKFFSEAWVKIKETWDKVKPYFEKLWDGIKKVFSVVKKIIGGYFQAAWLYIKTIWNNAKAYFEFVWNTIKGIFAVVKAVLSGDFKGAWEAIKDIWNGAKKFFSTIWDNIKNVFKTVDSWFGGVFSKAWKAIKDKFSGVKSFFTGIFTTIKGIFKDIGTKIGDAMGGAIKSTVNTIISFAENTINKFIRAINSAIGIINKIPGVSISKLNELSIPKLEKGGVLKKGQVGLLEGNGAEAVVPLEKNKKWIQKTARDMRTSLQNEGVLKGGNTQTAPQTVNNTFNQYNTSPKALSRYELYRQTKNQLAMAKGV